MIITLLIARMCSKILRLIGKGATTFPGKIALYLKKDILKVLSQNVRVIMVTGTNGKTTTSRIIEEGLNRAGLDCFLNRSGANLITGITAAFIENCDLKGRCKKKYAVIECDENALKKVSRYIDAEILVVTNIFRDQLDRYGEVMTTLSAIKQGADNMKNALLVLNADDPLSFSLSRSGSKYVSFGIDNSLSLGGKGENEYCVFCHTPYRYSFRTYCQLGGFECEKCGYKREKPNYSAVQIIDLFPDYSTVFADLNGKSALLKVNLAGVYNIYNALAAAAALSRFGLSVPQIENSLSSFGGAFGRMENFGKTRMLLVKNPAGLTQTMSYVSSLKAQNLIFVLNDNDADGRDVSWIWDAEIVIPQSVKHIYTFGIRSGDMALRLKYAGYSPEIIKNYSQFYELTDKDNTVIVPTYTAMMAIRPYLAKKFRKDDFWK